MHVLLTRPERDYQDLKSSIEALGCKVAVAPLLNIEFNVIAADALDGAGGLVATSRNGLRALAQSPVLDTARKLPLFAVGTATAELAHELGFRSILTGPGAAADLVPVITNHPASKSGFLIHLASDHVAFSLGSALHARGISLKRVEAYRSVAAKTLSLPVLGLLQHQELDAVILMSPRTARIWSGLIQALAKTVNLDELQHICLSPAVAQGLQGLGDVKIEVTAHPQASEIVALVYRLAGAPKTG